MRNKKLQMRMNNLKKNNIVKDANIKELIKGPKEIKSPNQIEKNNFEKFLATIESNKFNYKNKIDEFKYIDIKDLVNNIKNNTISEIDAKKDLNTLNEIKNAEIIKYKKCTPGHKELLNLFNDSLDIVLTDRTLESESQEDENENENEDDDDIIKILTFLNEYAETKNENEKNIIIKKIK